ncbi:hypothetical protein SCHPADRAFT_886352 [Schizopora paradoxa]|uniref:Uncharacterized protein n=1 Tax=Schizopora paradoxa TaxID=27342 RepID=A0A0H2S1P3_9AGAM|nr:hypothetical protein SCHPADRAFT_886352 [Schizopora paradoxa]
MQRTSAVHDAVFTLPDNPRKPSRFRLGSIGLKLLSKSNKRKKRSNESSFSGACRSTAAVAELGVRALQDSSDVCPPLKSALGLICHVINLLEEVKDIEEKAERTQMKAFRLLDDLAKQIPDETIIPQDLAIALKDLSDKFQEVIYRITTLRKKSVFTRIVRKKSHTSQLTLCMRHLDDAIESFKIRSQVRIELAMQKISTQSAISAVDPGASPLARPTFRAGYFTC